MVWLKAFIHCPSIVVNITGSIPTGRFSLFFVSSLSQAIFITIFLRAVIANMTQLFPSMAMNELGTTTIIKLRRSQDVGEREIQICRP